MFDYFLQPQRVIKPRGNLKELAYVCPQAFGRNTYSDQEVSGALRELFSKLSMGPYAEYDIQCFQLLERSGFDPGFVNNDLASQCFSLSTGGDQSCIPRPIVGQWEVLYALWRMHKSWYEENQQYFIVIWPPSDGSYLTTRGLLEKSRSFMRNEGGIAIIAQAVHAARCVRLADKIFGSHRIIVLHLGRARYDKRSVQEWTRNEKGFLAWERKARIFEELPEFVRNILRHLLEI